MVTIGAYDGVHLGHQAVIADVIEHSQRLSVHSAVVTFDRHPASVVRPETAPRLLTDDRQKLELLEATGVEAVVVIHFDHEQAAEQPDHFVHRVMVDALGVCKIVVGEDFHFGRGRAGNVTMLRRLGDQFGFDVDPLDLLPRLDGVGEPISSTAIRRALAGGEVELAAAMLGRPLEVRGVVVNGDRRGRTLGFPTANVEVPNAICLPADGVYAGWYERPNGDVHGCVMNLGRRPTFYEHSEHSLLEVHLLDFAGDLYGEQAEVRFVHFIRGERKFDGLDALVQQVRLDTEHARAALGAQRGSSTRP